MTHPAAPDPAPTRADAPLADWTALLLAGERPGGDPLARAAGVRWKALLPIGGRPMLLHPLDALLAAGCDRVLVATQAPADLEPVLPDDPRIRLVPSGASIAATLEPILADPGCPYPLLVTTADHALLTPAMLADFAAAAAGADVATGLVGRRALMARLPETRRTWIRFAKESWSGANLFAFGSPAALRAIALWRGVEQDRKKGLALVGTLGPMALIGALLRLRTLDQTVAAVGRRLGLDARAVAMTDPLAAVDVDKPDDARLVESLLAERGAKGGAR
jgi:GTP:adenosylcobinamide-phosphate guanylyltransferase